MDQNVKTILRQFDERNSVLESLSKTAETLINSLLNHNQIYPHQICSRLKNRTSLEKKILRKGLKYKNIDDITDIVGLRIISYFEDEIDDIAKIINEEFKIDVENSIDKRQIDSDKFGYRSLHFVVSFNRDRIKLKEYALYDNIKFEIQIRSILQHSWAEIEHDLGYKGASEIPSSAKRTFYRVAALLEQADIEFVKLKNTIAEYESNIYVEIKEKPSDVKIDKASLHSFVTKSEIVEKIENKIASINSKIYIDEDTDPNIFNEKLIKKMNLLQIYSVKDIENIYIKFEKEFIEFTQAEFMEESVVGFMKGASLIWLIDYINNKNKI